jgi:hypothetical protein
MRKTASRISTASDYLGVKLKHLPRIESLIFGRETIALELLHRHQRLYRRGRTLLPARHRARILGKTSMSSSPLTA